MLLSLLLGLTSVMMQAVRDAHDAACQQAASDLVRSVFDKVVQTFKAEEAQVRLVVSLSA